MILLITCSERGAECAEQLQQATGERVRLEGSLRRAAAVSAGDKDISAMVIDDALMETDERGADMLLSRAGTAVPVVLNLGISGTHRMIRMVRTALRRREQLRSAAAAAAQAVLWREINDSVTGILLLSGLPLENQAGDPKVAERLRTIHDIAAGIRDHFQAKTEVRHTRTRASLASA